MKDKETIRWLLKNAGAYRFYMIGLLLLQALLSGAALGYALAMKTMIDGAVAGKRQEFFAGLLTFAMLVLIQILLRILLRYLEEAAKSGLENTLKQRLFAALLQKDYASVSAKHSEDWMNRMTSDTTVCGSGLADILPGFTGMLVRLVGAMIMIFVLQPKLAYVMVPGGLLFVGITMILRKQMKQFHKRVQEKDGAVRVYLQERISSMLVIRVFGAEDAALAGAEKGFSEHKKARMQKATVSNLCNTGFAAAMNGMYLLGIGYCGYGILQGLVSYGTLTAIMQLIGQLQAPLAGISGFVPRFYAMLASAERLMEAEAFAEADVQSMKTPEAAREFYRLEFKELVFDKVSFTYGKEEKNLPVLKDISLCLQKGDYVAVTGASGCGKSTLLKLLMGVYTPKEGKITIAAGENEKLPLLPYKRLFSYVPQGNFLMGGTIREAITFGREQSDTSITVEQAVRLACGEFLWELPEGLDTVLGEKGAGLSEGQMQRIAIARALYADTPVLILDEATSALDEETEQQLLKNLKQLTDKTVWIVTHRPAALDICNRRLCFMEDGSIIESQEDGKYE